MAREAVRQAPASAEAWYLLGLLCDERGDWVAADEAYAKAHEFDTQHVSALLRRARLQRAHGRFEGARWLLDLAQRHASSKDGELADMRAQLLLDEGDAGSARGLLVPRLRADPAHAERWRLLAAAPFLPFYASLVLAPVRLWSTTVELLRVRREDPYLPQSYWRNARLP